MKPRPVLRRWISSGGMSWADFVELLTHTFERTTIPLDETAHRGVTVVDAMAARGLSFKAVCVLV